MAEFANIYIWCHPEQHTTGRYYYKCLQARNYPVHYICRKPDISQIKKNDFLLFIDPGSGEWVSGLEHLPCLSACYLIDVHLSIEFRLSFAEFFDYIFVAQKDVIPSFRERGFEAFWLPLACDETFAPSSEVSRDIDLGFVGKQGARGTWRRKVLSRVLTEFKTNDYMRIYTPDEMGKSHEVYNRSKMVFNCSIQQDLNMRVFEAMVAGSLLVTDRIPNGQEELFKENEHYIAYSDPEEAIEKISYFLQHSDERSRIAGNGQKLVLKKHRYIDRWRSIEETIEKHPGKQAFIRTCSESEKNDAYARIYYNLLLAEDIYVLMKEKGVSTKLIFAWLKIMLRKLNRRVPFTPNAIKHYIKNK